MYGHPLRLTPPRSFGLPWRWRLEVGRNLYTHWAWTRERAIRQARRVFEG